MVISLEASSAVIIKKLLVWTQILIQILSNHFQFLRNGYLEMISGKACFENCLIEMKKNVVGVRWYIFWKSTIFSLKWQFVQTFYNASNLQTGLWVKNCVSTDIIRKSYWILPSVEYLTCTVRYLGDFLFFQFLKSL